MVRTVSVRGMGKKSVMYSQIQMFIFGQGARIKSLVLHGNAHPTNGEFWKKMWNAEIMWNSHVDFKYFLQIWNDQKKRLAITKLFREHSETAINKLLDGSEK